MIKKTFFLATLLFTNYTVATLSFEVKCSSPDLNYLNRFGLEQSFNVWEESPNVYGVHAVDMTAQYRDAGSNSQEAEETFRVRGTITKIQTSNTKVPYYAMKLKNDDKTVLVQMNLNYPGALTSSIKTSEGRLYKAKCVLKKIEGCIFGSAFSHTRESINFKITEYGEELKIIPDFSDENLAVNTKKIGLTYIDGRQYNAWYTFQDEVDGGNTYGVIEDLKGKVVATIADSDIYNCQANR